jgi:hypothetical protein
MSSTSENDPPSEPLPPSTRAEDVAIKPVSHHFLERIVNVQWGGAVLFHTGLKPNEPDIKV